LAKGGDAAALILSVAGQSVAGLQENAVALTRNTSETVIFDLKGVPLAELSARPQSRNFSTDFDDVSFDPRCGHVLIWTPNGLVLNYTKKLKIFDLPWPIPFFWHRPGSGCEN
jgi:hypothetical protein